MPLIFVKTRDIIHFKNIKKIDMYEAVVEKVNPEHVFGVQHIGMLWRIYLSNPERRTTLLTQHITTGEQSIEWFSNNPLRARLKKGKHDRDIIRIMIRGMLLSKGNSSIEEFLGANNVTLRRSIWKGKLRNKNNIQLNVYSGDRIILC